MQIIFEGIGQAIALIFSTNGEFWCIVWTSVSLAGASTFLAALLGIPFGLFLAVSSFRGKMVVEIALETLFSLPTVLIGLVGYAFLREQGPLSGLGLLYTKSAIVLGQMVLIVPLIAALTNASMKTLYHRYGRTLYALGANRSDLMVGLMREGKGALGAILLAAFGRVFSEVGIAMMLGGNIAGETRTITTAIALETARGEFALGIALGIVLLLVSLLLTLTASLLRRIS